MKALAILTLLGVILLLGCVGQPSGNETGNQTGNASIANPASVYCQDNGGQVVIRTDAGGNQYGICVFPNGTECDEWAYFRGECSPIFTSGSFKPVVEACSGNSITVYNNGTGTIVLNSTTIVTKSGGFTSYGLIPVSVHIQPGASAVVQLPMNLYNTSETSFLLDTRIGATRYLTPFYCIPPRTY